MSKGTIKDFIALARQMELRARERSMDCAEWGETTNRRIWNARSDALTELLSEWEKAEAIRAKETEEEAACHNGGWTFTIRYDVNPGEGETSAEPEKTDAGMGVEVSYQPSQPSTVEPAPQGIQTLIKSHGQQDVWKDGRLVTPAERQFHAQAQAAKAHFQALMKGDEKRPPSNFTPAPDPAPTSAIEEARALIKKAEDDRERWEKIHADITSKVGRGLL